MNKSDIEEALCFDGLSFAERITGASYKTDKNTESLGVALHITHNQDKQKLLKSAGDSYYGMPMSDWISMVESMGFKEVFSMPIPETPDTFHVFWMSGVLLTADTYGGNDRLNSSNAYFHYKGPRNAMFKCSNGHAGVIDGQDIWSGHVDAREGFRFAMEKMQAAGEFLPAWTTKPWLWLLHYMDTKTEGYDYNAINAERIAMLPPEVQAAIAGNS